MKDKLIDYLPEFTEALKQQLEQDEKRWGETWKYRSIEGQEERTFSVFHNYEDQFNNANIPVNWLKVAGNALICWVREQEQKDKKKG